MNPTDIERILSRDTRTEIQRWTGGLTVKGAKVWVWEVKYHRFFSTPLKLEELAAAYTDGMLKAEQIPDGAYVWGICRNARVARWSRRDQCFYYRRLKGEWRTEAISHPDHENDKGFDVFIPWLTPVSPLDFERVDIPSITAF
ncbi:MAG: hypothetical protein JNL01_03160 [Bdellovibrionales bacterium]|nr:hypothetical protein [Bdellovibrionales bacterium]